MIDSAIVLWRKGEKELIIMGLKRIEILSQQAIKAFTFIKGWAIMYLLNKGPTS